MKLDLALSNKEVLRKSLVILEFLILKETKTECSWTKFLGFQKSRFQCMWNKNKLDSMSGETIGRRSSTWVTIHRKKRTTAYHSNEEKKCKILGDAWVTTQATKRNRLTGNIHLDKNCSDFVRINWSWQRLQRTKRGLHIIYIHNIDKFVYYPSHCGVTLGGL